MNHPAELLARAAAACREIATILEESQPALDPSGETLVDAAGLPMLRETWARRSPAWIDALLDARAVVRLAAIESAWTLLAQLGEHALGDLSPWNRWFEEWAEAIEFAASSQAPAPIEVEESSAVDLPEHLRKTLEVLDDREFHTLEEIATVRDLSDSALRIHLGILEALRLVEMGPNHQGRRRTQAGNRALAQRPSSGT
ncbi:MAG: hypothetical protein AB7I19_20155 [Planctomycetota bacterium]